MTTYTLYFKEGHTWTDDYVSDEQAERCGHEIASAEDVTYTHFERCEPVSHWHFTPDTM